MNTNKTAIVISFILIIFSFISALLLIWRIQSHNTITLLKTNSVTTNQVAATAIKTGTSYRSVTSYPTGWFSSGQNADLTLSAIGFNNAGGPLTFNHLGNIASDGRHLLVADRNNNRILIWNSLPKSNIPPNIVLGQENFTNNNPGTGMNNLDWPVSVATDGTHVFVADTYNNRILIWNSFPTRNDQSADIVLNNVVNNIQNPTKNTIIWPWAVWTNGKKLIVTSTQSGSVLIWNSIPTRNNQPADILLNAGGNFGTPRSIASDGKTLMIGDHNAKLNNGNPGNFFWSTFPTKDNEPYSSFISTQSNSQSPGNVSEIFWGGVYTPDGKFLSIGNTLLEWNSFPQNSSSFPNMIIGGSSGGVITANSNDLYQFDAGDGSGEVLAGNTLYVSLSNGNRIIGFNSIPTTQNAKPDFSIGSPNINTNTLLTNYIMSNPVPATNGKSLFVSSDFDKSLYVYKNLPNQSNAYPDYVIPYGGWSNALYGNTFAEADTQSIYIWNTLPTNGQLPNEILTNHIGNVHLQSAKGVAIDSQYFYISDSEANKVYVFKGIPTYSSNPIYTINVNQPYRISSDGTYLVVTTTLDNLTGHVKVYMVNQLSNNIKPIWTLTDKQIQTNLPESAVVSHGSLFIADTGFNRVLIWKNITEAIQGKQPDTVLGESILSPILVPQIGTSTLFWPSNVAFDGSFLWVGEFKFSERLLRYSVH